MTADNFRGVSTPELERRWSQLRDELFALRREIDRRKGDVPPPIDVNFEKYVTK